MCRRLTPPRALRSYLRRLIGRVGWTTQTVNTPGIAGSYEYPPYAGTVLLSPFTCGFV